MYLKTCLFEKRRKTEADCVMGKNVNADIKAHTGVKSLRKDFKYLFIYHKK